MAILGVSEGMKVPEGLHTGQSEVRVAFESRMSFESRHPEVDSYDGYQMSNLKAKQISCAFEYIRRQRTANSETGIAASTMMVMIRRINTSVSGYESMQAVERSFSTHA